MDEFTKRNSFASVSFVRFPYNEVSADDITVEDSDIRDYYNSNKELYQTEENYCAKFVAFSTLPTAEDSSIIRGELEDLRRDFAEAENDSVFMIREQSTTPFGGIYIEKDDLREDYAPVLDVAIGEVTEVLDLVQGAAIIKKLMNEEVISSPYCLKFLKHYQLPLMLLLKWPMNSSISLQRNLHLMKKQSVAS